MKKTFTLITSAILSAMILNAYAGHPCKSVGNTAADAEKTETAAPADDRGKVTVINSKAEFEKIKKPAVVDFYATWCGPCRKIAPILETLAKEYAGKVYFYKVDVDACGDLAAIYGISSIPAVAYFPVRGEYEMTVGFRPKAQFETEINTILLGK